MPFLSRISSSRFDPFWLFAIAYQKWTRHIILCLLCSSIKYFPISLLIRSNMFKPILLFEFSYDSLNLTCCYFKFRSYLDAESDGSMRNNSITFPSEFIPTFIPTWFEDWSRTISGNVSFIILNDKMYAYCKQKRYFSIRILQFHKCFF